MNFVQFLTVILLQESLSVTRALEATSGSMISLQGQTLVNESSKVLASSQDLAITSHINGTSKKSTTTFNSSQEVNTTQPCQLVTQEPEKNNSIPSSSDTRLYCKTVKQLKHIFIGIVAPLGITGNLMSIRVLVYLRTSMGMSVLLSILAVEDCLFLLMMFVLYPAYNLLIDYGTRRHILLYIAR